MDTDKLAAYQTLYQCLVTIAKLIAPFSPFYADQLYRDLTGDKESVHLVLFPDIDESAIDSALEKRMNLAQTVTSLVLSLRRRANLKVRQPLSHIMIPAVDEEQRNAIEAVSDLLKNELNVKDVKIVGSEDGVLVKRVKPDFKKLGPKFGKSMKSVASAISSMSQQDIAGLEATGKVTLDINGTPAVIESQDVEIISEDIPGWLVANEGNVTVALDINVTDELRREGIAREIVNRVQNIRKSRDYEITDRIQLTIDPLDEDKVLIDEFGDYIGRQVLAKSVVCGVIDENDPDAELLTMDDVNVRVRITLA